MDRAAYPSSSISTSSGARLWLRRGALFCAGVVAALIALEGVMRLLPVTMGFYRTEHPDLWPLYNFQSRTPYTYSMTWEMLYPRYGITNNYGQLAPFDYVTGSRPVIVVGDSYIESQMNDFRDTLQGDLGRMMGSSIPVYGLGVSGLSLSDYLALTAQAKTDFAPRAAVFLIVDGDISESLLDQVGHYYFRATNTGFALDFHPMDQDPLLKRVRYSIGEIHLYRYLTSNLRFSAPDFRRILAALKPREEGGGSKAQAAPAHYAVVDHFLSELPRRSGIESRCIAFLLDADRYAIYDPRLASTPKDEPELRGYFVRRAAELGYHVSDLRPLFSEDFAKHRRHFDYWPIDRHWNRLAHRLAADEAYRLLFGPGDRRCGGEAQGPAN